MDLYISEELGILREWAPCSQLLNSIPPKVQSGIFSNELYLTCVDAVDEYIAIGSNVGLVYWYDRKTGEIQRLRCEKSQSPITFVKIADTVDYMVAAGNVDGQVGVFQIPKKLPDSLPDSVKPKADRKVERYSINEMHNGPVTAIEWSKNGMKLFSGDVNGVIVHTEIDFYMHLCKSHEILNETHEIVQMSYWQGNLLVSSVYRSILCEKKDSKWQVSQIGNKERKSLCRLGGVFQWSVTSPNASIYCARPGLRIWCSDFSGNVQQTFLFKDAVRNPTKEVELLNPSHEKHVVKGKEFGPLHIFKENLIVTYNDEVLYILDPRSLTAFAAVDHLRRIMSVCVNKEEIFILEGPRSLVRVAFSPEAYATAPEDPLNLMTKSLTDSLHKVMSTVRDLTRIDQTVPLIANILEQPVSVVSQLSSEDVSNAEECLELPPVRELPDDIDVSVLPSIVAEFRDISEYNYEHKLKTEEIQKKLKLYDEIMGKEFEKEVLYNRLQKPSKLKRQVSEKRVDVIGVTELVNGKQTTKSPAGMMSRSVYESRTSESLENIEKEIENKEKMLAKMLDLESLSIPQKPLNKICNSSPRSVTPEAASPPTIVHRPDTKRVEVGTAIPSVRLTPQVSMVPNTWNLEKIRFDFNDAIKPKKVVKQVPQVPQSPDETSTGEWELV